MTFSTSSRRSDRLTDLTQNDSNSHRLRRYGRYACVPNSHETRLIMLSRLREDDVYAAVECLSARNAESTLCSEFGSCGVEFTL